VTNEPKDLTVDTQMVEEQLAADPEMAEYVRDFAAKMRQAFAAVQSGQHKTMDEAVRAQGIEMVKLDPDTGEEIEGASLQEDMGLGDADIETVLSIFGGGRLDDEEKGDA
jgi:hypothetical protein